MGTTKIQRQAKAERAITAPARKAAHTKMVADAASKKRAHQADVKARAAARWAAAKEKAKIEAAKAR